MREEEKNNALTYAALNFKLAFQLVIQRLFKFASLARAETLHAKQSKVSRTKLRTRDLIDTSEVLIVDKPSSPRNPN